MPIYMDRHDLPESVTAEHVAHIHQEDLKIQNKFGCEGLTYWFDEQRKTAFCLIKAPNKEAIQRMHDEAHGGIPNSIIEVDAEIVESFLGRIEDPEKSQNTELNIINDAAFRTIMVIGIKTLSLKDSSPDHLNATLQNQSLFIAETTNKFKGNIIKQKLDYFLISFDSVSNAVLCSIEIQTNLKQTIDNGSNSDIQLNIGLNAGIPVTEKDCIFEDTIKMAERLCDVVEGKISITTNVKDLYEIENLNIPIDNKFVITLHSNEEMFLNLLMDYTEREWNNTSLNVDDFSRGIGYSKSQLYRKMISITGKSPNAFIKEYRLNNALKLLNKRMNNISEIAFKTGFNSPAYFSKCFLETYGILPSIYTRQQEVHT